MSQKRKLNAYSYSFKQDIINDYDSGVKNKEISKKYNISHSTVSNIIKNREKILNVNEHTKTSKRLRSAKNPELEEDLVQYLEECKDANIPVSGKLIQEAAKDFAAMNQIKEFKASDKWKANFMKRNHIGSRKSKRESAGPCLEEKEPEVEEVEEMSEESEEPTGVKELLEKLLEQVNDLKEGFESQSARLENIENMCLDIKNTVRHLKEDASLTGMSETESVEIL